METGSPLNWFVFYFVLGLLLGQFALRDWKWAAVCGLVNALAMAFVMPKLDLPMTYPTIHFALVGVGLLVLWGISRLRPLPARVGAALVVTPLVSWAVAVAGFLAFLTIFQIP